MLEKAYIALQTLLVGIWTLQVILIKSDKMEIRTMLEAGGKVVLVVKCQRTWLNCSSILWKVEVKSEKFGYLARKISKQSV